MIRNIFIFLGTFVAGALIALVARAAMFEPHAASAAPATGGGDYAAQVSNPLVPAVAPEKSSAPSAPASSHDGHATAAAAGKPVNTVCAICGMPVDPALPTAQYQGKTIGFGCKMCPPKFKAAPDRYGPFYLRNEVIKP